ncbi:MAG: diaminopimelate epimerase [Candidatus Omnitrophica bacterium]|nr:diaminopimelate epimerase [Candidatus Omnitrophota bacterium]MCM8788842.1 diaminopimelate epimerase [Candidatus Omnitrophota bacterium]
MKITGSGNDFVLINNLDGKIRNRRRLAIDLCRYKYGVGADGAIFLEKSKKADFKMRIFNADGSEAEMCGNGLRCLIRLIYEQKISRKKLFLIETLAGIYETRMNLPNVSIKMFLINKPEFNKNVEVDEETFTVHFLNTGVPHAVIIVDNVDNVDVKKYGPIIRYHRIFQPAGTNVDWVEIIDAHHGKIRTYERGVEDETLACGTGIVAGVICAAMLGKFVSPVDIIARSGEKLKVSFEKDFTDIFLEGRTKLVFEGQWIDR